MLPSFSHRRLPSNSVCIVFLTNTLLYSRLVLAKNTMQDFPTTRTPIFSMIFGKVERRRTFRTSSEYLSKSAEIAAFWRVLTQLPVTEFERKRKCCRSVYGHKIKHRIYKRKRQNPSFSMTKTKVETRQLVATLRITKMPTASHLYNRFSVVRRL